MKKIYTIIVLLIFVCNNAWAQEIDAAGGFMISEANGTIRDSYFAGDSNTILVHIQDLHCNYDAQISIYNIINELREKYGLNLVAVEGSIGRLETAPFSSYPDERIKEDVARWFVKRGKFDGAALAHVMSKSGFTFWGVDDPKMYNENVEAYKVSLEAQNSMVKYYDNMSGILKQFKDKTYSDDLKELDSKIAAYKDETLDFSQYIAYLVSLMDKHAIDKSAYKNVTILSDVLKKEADIDFLQVDTERAAYMDKLNEQLKDTQLSELLDKSLYFKLGRISALDFYTYLQELSTHEGIAPLTEYPQLAKYIEYIKEYATIENIRLFQEIEALETALKEKLFSSDMQRSIDTLSKNLDTINDLFNLRLTKDTLHYYRDHRKDITASYFVNFITANAKQYGINYKLDPAFRDIDRYLSGLEEFYRLAEERDTALVDNTIAKMRENRAKVAVLISGGFHTDGITQLLKERQLSYVVITPKVDSLQDDNPYKTVLLGGRDSFDRLFDTLNTKE